MNDIETYAMRIVADYAESGIEDNVDEDGEFAADEEGDSPDHEEACDLAMDVVRWIRANEAEVLRIVREAKA